MTKFKFFATLSCPSLSPDGQGLKVVDSMIKLAGCVEEDGLDRGRRNVIGERKGGDEVSK
jgi:hypothetical protein